MLKPERAPNQRDRLTAGANVPDKTTYSIKDLSNNSLIDKQKFLNPERESTDAGLSTLEFTD